MSRLFLRTRQVLIREDPLVHRVWKAPSLRWAARTCCDQPFFIVAAGIPTLWKAFGGKMVAAARPSRRFVNCLACLGSPLRHEDDVQT